MLIKYALSEQTLPLYIHMTRRGADGNNIEEMWNMKMSWKANREIKVLLTNTYNMKLLTFYFNPHDRVKSEILDQMGKPELGYSIVNPFFVSSCLAHIFYQQTRDLLMASHGFVALFSLLTESSEPSLLLLFVWFVSHNEAVSRRVVLFCPQYSSGVV